MGQLSWSAEAEASLRAIYSTMARTRPETARRTLESLLNKIDSLATYPDLGQPYRYRHGRPIRVLTYGGFQVAYRVEDEDEESIAILAVFHGPTWLPK